MPSSGTRILHRVGCAALVGFVALWVLGMFLRPGARHVGMNGYERSKFVEMVEGRAWKPYVSRALLPALTNGLSRLLPDPSRTQLTRAIRGNHFALRTFQRLEWEPEQAHRYLAAVPLLFASFLGFAHFAARLAMRTLGLHDDLAARTRLGVAALLVLPPFFVCASYPYDPPQLCLFAAALHFLASGRLAMLAGTFVLCCLNKETAVLLIPITAFALREERRGRRGTVLLAGMTIGFALVRLAAAAAFRSNPGSAVEFHLVDRTIHMLTRPWSFPELAAACAVGFLLFHRWNEKPLLLRAAFLGTYPPLFLVACFFGDIDEWRAFYEAVPAAFCLGVHTVRRLASPTS